MTDITNNKKIVKIGVFLILGLIVALLIGRYVLRELQKKSRASGEYVTLSFNPSSMNASPGQNFGETQIKVKPSADMYIRGYEFRLKFSNSLVEVKRIVYNLGTVSTGLGDETNLSEVNNRGYVNIVGAIYSSANGILLSSSSDTNVVAITWAAKAAGSSNVSVEGVDFRKINTTTFELVHVYLQSDSAAPSLSLNGGGTTTVTLPPTTPTVTTISPTVTVTGQPTITPSTGGNVTLDLKLKFQGIVKKPTDAQAQKIKIKVKIGGRKLAKSTDYQEGTFTYNNDNTWTGTVSFNIPSFQEDSSYIVYVKGEQHIQKKIGDQNPTENIEGGYHFSEGKISLHSGVNILNFSGIFLPVGDLPTTNGAQKGHFDSVDAAFISQNLGSNDSTKLKVGDLNRDGQITSIDYDLLMQSLTRKYDED